MAAATWRGGCFEDARTFGAAGAPPFRSDCKRHAGRRFAVRRPHATRRHRLRWRGPSVAASGATAAAGDVFGGALAALMAALTPQSPGAASFGANVKQQAAGDLGWARSLAGKVQADGAQQPPLRRTRISGQGPGGGRRRRGQHDSPRSWPRSWRPSDHPGRGGAACPRSAATQPPPRRLQRRRLRRPRRRHLSPLLRPRRPPCPPIC